MKTTVLYFSICAALLCNSGTADGQIVPQLHLNNTSVGGTGAAKKALMRLNLPESNRKVLNRLEGPAEGWSRSRHDVQTYQITDAELPGVKDYYLRSSTVVLDPGGASGIHSHFERPAFLQVVSGSVFQHRSDAVSYYMGPGDFTFTSHGLAHWWLNESEKEPMRVWIVELCTGAHHCDAVVHGGAVALKGSEREGATNLEATTIYEIDLANEFKEAPITGTLNLRLRKIVIKPGQSVSDGAPGGHVAFLRLAEGTLSADGEDYATGAFLHAPAGLSKHVFTNSGKGEAVLWAVDISSARAGSGQVSKK